MAEERDRLLTSAIAPAMAGLRTKGLAERWFFVRYYDRPRRRDRARTRGPHLRLRLDVPGPHTRACVDGLLDWLPRAAIQPSVYRPEVARYGGPQALGPIEEIFCLDSELVVDILLDGSASSGRVGTSVLAIDALLKAFRMAPEERKAFYRHVARCGFPWNDDAALDAIYTQKREAFVALLRFSRADREDAGFGGCWEERLAGPARRLRALEAKSALTQPLRRILESLVHMHYNRLGLSSEQERGVKWCLGRAAEDLG